MPMIIHTELLINKYEIYDQCNAMYVDNEIYNV
jgi:hypothetical protein